MATRTVLLTGASGVMGQATLTELLDDPELTVIAPVLDQAKERKAMARFDHPRLRVAWGDLRDSAFVHACVLGSDVVLHLAAVVSPLADHHPELAMDVNVHSMENLIAAVRAANQHRDHDDPIALVNIGTVAETGDRPPPIHWGRVGDPIRVSMFDVYADSKVIAERMLIDSGLPRWVSVRQTGILHDSLFLTRDPIMFHTPLSGVLEWVGVKDSARLMHGLARADAPAEMWRRVYNVGGGEDWRLTNYEFFRRAYAALGIKDFQGTVRRSWFATRNFHGQWFTDSHILNDMFRYRHEHIDEVFAAAARRTPWYFHLAGLLPPRIMRDLGMRPLARKHSGPLRWLEHDPHGKLDWYYESRAAAESIGDWSTFTVPNPTRRPSFLDHGYPEDIPSSEWNDDMYRDAATFRGGTFIGFTVPDAGPIPPAAPRNLAAWRCYRGHEFTGSPWLILRTGHWCPSCTSHPERIAEQAAASAFIKQLVP